MRIWGLAFGTVGLLTVMGLSACGPAHNFEPAQYWQRVSVSEAVYQRGPKAQQVLNRDIARCVTELRELERLGAVKNAIPTDYRGRVLDSDEAQLEDWDTPARDEHLYAEHNDYHDFEGCMLAKGWERVLYAPYDVATEARDNYVRAHIDYAYESRIGKRHDSMSRKNAAGYTDDYSNVNE